MTDVLIVALVVVAAFVVGVIFAVKQHDKILEKKDQLTTEYQDLAAKASAERDAMFHRVTTAVDALKAPPAAVPSPAPAPAPAAPPPVNG